MEFEHSQAAFNVNSDHQDLRIILFSEFPLSYPGGGERLIKLIHIYFKNTGIDSKIIENTRKQGGNSQSNQNSHMESNGVEFKRYGSLKFLHQDFPPLEAFPTDENAISLIFIRRVPPSSVLNELERTGSKVIFCLHGIALERIRFTNPLIIVHQLLMRIKLRDLAHHTRKHIFVQSLTPHQTSYLVAHGADSKNIFTIGNQFESEVSFPVRNDDEFRVIFIGRMEDLQKGIKRLRKVIRTVLRLDNNIKFDIIGSGNDRRKLDGLGKGVNILEGIEDKRKNEILATSNLALVTSNLEPFSLVMLEYLAFGIPIISTPASGPSFILSKGPKFGKAVSFNAKALAKAILAQYSEWKKDKEQYFRLRMEIFLNARKIFSSKKMLESYRQMIIQVGKIK